METLRDHDHLSGDDNDNDNSLNIESRYNNFNENQTVSTLEFLKKLGGYGENRIIRYILYSYHILNIILTILLIYVNNVQEV